MLDVQFKTKTAAKNKKQYINPPCKIYTIQKAA